MSYMHSASLQKALYSALTSSSELNGLISGHVFDAMPSGTLPDLFVSLGAETVQDISDKTAMASLHDVTISVITTYSGFLEAKIVASAIGKVLLSHGIELDQAHLTYLNFQRANARRDTDSQTRRIDMVFRARIDNHLVE